MFWWVAVLSAWLWIARIRVMVKIGAANFVLSSEQLGDVCGSRRD
jgi:hypothetical protein